MNRTHLLTLFGWEKVGEFRLSKKEYPFSSYK
jgi:hypothetical protein